jgi:cystathionine beta-lyase
MAKLTPDTHRTLGSRTRLVHAGRDPGEQHGFINTPVYRGSTVLYDSVARLSARDQRFTYGTKGTPTTEALERAWSEIAGAAGTVLTPSGLAAVTVALMAVLGSGDDLLVSDIEMIRMDEIEPSYQRMVKSDVKYRFVIDMASLPKAA